MKLELLPFEGACLIHGYRVNDERGWFWKNYQETQFEKLGIYFKCKETFFSSSVTGVLRGMHFQAPPKPSAKLVTCVAGNVIDVIFDLRANSPTYGFAKQIELDDKDNISIYIPVGIAHGFYVKEGPAVLTYQTDVPYDSDLDQGIRWDSIPYSWPILSGRTPILSGRDRLLPAWDNFETPFF
jgi:dTDP-4-dehydrorhamnose 3,5-epimerase